MMTFVAGCEIPQAPGELWWDVDLNVPFGVRTYGLWELAEPDSVLRESGSGVGMTEDSALYFSAWAELSAALGDSLYASGINRRIERRVTALQIPLDYDTLLAYSLGRLNPEIATLHGTTQNLPVHSLEGTIALPYPGQYDSMEVDTGTAMVVLVNRLAYGITDVEVRAGSKLVAEIPSLARDQQAVITADLSTARLGSSFELELSAIGSGGTGIVVDSASRLSATLVTDTVTASRFYGFLPEQYVVRDSTVGIEQQHVIDLAIIASGNMNVTVVNQTQFPDTVILRIPNLVSRLNDTLEVKRFLLPGDSDTTTISLAQFRLRPNGTETQTITGQIISHTPASTEHIVFEAGTERVYGRVEIDRLPMEYFEGTLRNLELTFDNLSVEIERPPQGWENARPLEVEARVHVEHGIGGMLDADMLARTSYLGNEIGETPLVINDLPLTEDTVAVIEYLAELLADYPDLLTATGSAVVNGEVALYNNTDVQIGLELRAGLAVRIEGEIEPVGTVERVETQDLQDIESGTALIKVWNHVPTSARCYVVADFDSANVLQGSGAAVDTLLDVVVVAPLVVNGMAEDTSYTELEVELTDTWLNYFRSNSFFVRTQISLSAQPGDSLVITGHDFVAVQPVAKIQYAVRPGDIE
ncbi:MAG: hypothetical protein H6506_04190 [Calditrichaeota bacterium]|nr:hypothetical protein [Calditrichota bacterium]